MNANTISRFESTTIRTRHCTHEGCIKSTRGNKYLCVNHIEEMPYIQGLEARIKARQDEDSLVEKKGWTQVDVTASNSVEILQAIRNHGGAITLPRLSRNLNRNAGLQAIYVLALRKAGLITSSKNSRGGMVLRLA